MNRQNGLQGLQSNDKNIFYKKVESQARLKQYVSIQIWHRSLRCHV